MYKTKQTKKSLGIENLKGITIENVAKDKGYKVIYRVYDSTGVRRSTESLEEAVKISNKRFRSLFGDKRKAKKKGYWNEIM